MVTELSAHVRKHIFSVDPLARLLFLTTFSDTDYIPRALAPGAKGYVIKRDVASAVPDLQAVMAGQTVLGWELRPWPIGP